MKDRLLLAVRKFLETRIIPGRPVLLGYSGGPDSKALLYLLLECRRFFSLEVHLAHVDHGWRQESGQEAAGLQREAELLGIPFHLKTLSSGDFVPGNLEEQARELRLGYFRGIYAEYNCQALVLGHHADDRAEVVLKRVFEGASLFNLGGLAHEKLIHGTLVWRPLLGFSKKEVVEWLERRHMTYYQDPTNYSSANLRGKMRGEILPALSRSFGKEIASSLCRLGEESQQLKEYFSELNRPILASATKKEAKCSYLDLKLFLPIPLVQLKFLLREWLEGEKQTLSRQIFENIAEALIERDIGKKFITQAGCFQVERGCLHFVKN